MRVVHIYKISHRINGFSWLSVRALVTGLVLFLAMPFDYPFYILLSCMYRVTDFGFYWLNWF